MIALALFFGILSNATAWDESQLRYVCAASNESYDSKYYLYDNSDTEPGNVPLLVFIKVNKITNETSTLRYRVPGIWRDQRDIEYVRFGLAMERDYYAFELREGWVSSFAKDRSGTRRDRFQWWLEDNGRDRKWQLVVNVANSETDSHVRIGDKKYPVRCELANR